MNGYNVADACLADDRDAIIDLWCNAPTRHEMAEEKLRWYYLGNPDGLPQAFFLQAHGAPGAVGVASIAPRRMSLRSESVAAGVLMDFVVAPGHRGYFPALFLQKEVLRRAKPTHPVLFGMPNTLSEAVFRRAGYRCVGQVLRLVRVLHSREFLPDALPGWLRGILGAVIDHAVRLATSWRGLGASPYAWEWRDTPGGDFDALWQRVAPSKALIGVRDRAFLAWRFAQNPRQAYRFFALVAKAERKLVAYAVCNVEPETRAMHVADFLVDPGAPRAAQWLWLYLLREAGREGHRSLSVEFLGDPATRRELGTLGLVKREEHPLYAAFEDRPELSSASNWYVTSADRDG